LHPATTKEELGILLWVSSRGSVCCAKFHVLFGTFKRSLWTSFGGNAWDPIAVMDGGVGREGHLDGVSNVRSGIGIGMFRSRAMPRIPCHPLPKGGTRVAAQQRPQQAQMSIYPVDPASLCSSEQQAARSICQVEPASLRSSAQQAARPVYLIPRPV
jgi:hypothetical protein